MSEPPEIVVLDSRVDPATLRRLLERYEDMVEYVVDVERCGPGSASSPSP